MITDYKSVFKKVMFQGVEVIVPDWAGYIAYTDTHKETATIYVWSGKPIYNAEIGQYSKTGYSNQMIVGTCKAEPWTGKKSLQKIGAEAK